MVETFVFIFGSLLGSLANAYIYRFAQNKKTSKKTDRLNIISGRSICPSCKNTLKWYELIPIISYLAQKGLCRNCSERIDLQYPVVEITTGLLFLISYIFWPLPLTGPLEYALITLWFVLVFYFISLAIYDLKYMLLPNKMIVFTTVLSLVFAAVLALYDNSVTGLFIYLASGFGFFALFWLLFTVSDGQWIGGGDVKLSFSLGILAGGILQVFILLFLASVFGLLAIVIFSRGKLTDTKSKIPFGPMLLLATIAIVLFGSNLIEFLLPIDAIMLML